MKNLKWNPDGKDVIFTFSTIYKSCGRTVQYLVDYHDGLVSNKDINLSYPLEDSEIVQKLQDAVNEVEAEGKRARICIIDVVSSAPGVASPWVKLVKLCKSLGVLSMVDGAQGVGMVPLNVSAVDPDFFLTNCHKWLLVPRGCCILYAPTRNLHILPSSLATSNGYVSGTAGPVDAASPPSKGQLIVIMESVETCFTASHLCAVCRHSMAS